MSESIALNVEIPKRARVSWIERMLYTIEVSISERSVRAMSKIICTTYGDCMLLYVDQWWWQGKS
jgi:hypothetical protein